MEKATLQAGDARELQAFSLAKRVALSRRRIAEAGAPASLYGKAGVAFWGSRLPMCALCGAGPPPIPWMAPVTSG